jgi:hypothetical protein
LSLYNIMTRYVYIVAVLLYNLNRCIWQTTKTTVVAADVDFPSPFHTKNDTETTTSGSRSSSSGSSSVRNVKGNTGSLSSITDHRHEQLQPHQLQDRRRRRHLVETIANDDDTDMRLCDTLCENNNNWRKLPTDGVTTSFLDRLFGWLINGNIFTQLRNNIRNGNNRNANDIHIPTSLIVPKVTYYDNKLLSVSRQIRNNDMDSSTIPPPISATHSSNSNDDTTSTGSNLIATMYNASERNLILLSNELIHPIITELSQREYIDITTISCTMMQLLLYIQDTTLPTIMALTEVVYTKSNNVKLQNTYQTFISKAAVAATTTTSTTTANTKALQCSESHQLLSSEALSNARQDNLFPIISWLSACNDEMTIPGHIAAILINILLFPLSIVAGIVTGILSLFLLVLPGRAPATILILTFGAPFFVGFFILRNIRAIFQDLVNPIIVASDATMIQKVMIHFADVLDSPMPSIVASTLPDNRNNNDNSTDLVEAECEVRSLSCKNDVFMDVLP